MIEFFVVLVCVVAWAAFVIGAVVALNFFIDRLRTKGDS